MATTIATGATMMLLKPHAARKVFFCPQTHHYSQPVARHHHNCEQKQHERSRVTCCSLIHNSHSLEAHCQKLVDEFDPDIPIEKAVTPPSSWYTNSSFFDMEMCHVFHKGWQVVGNAEQIKDPHDFFTGRLGNVEFVVCRDDNGKLQAFHNVCRHHASLLASGSGQMSCFVCPYHVLRHGIVRRQFLGCGYARQGWTYGLDGALLKATRITGMQNFDVKDFGLIPINVAAWGPFVLLNLDKEISLQEVINHDMVENDWLGSCSEVLSTNGVDSSLVYICRRVYNIDCNWKVFCDNYLDGGYHVPYAHKGLASGLKLDSYATTLYEKVSIQRCKSGSTESEDDFDRLGSEALYAFIYPNFMINRYGPWMDTNLVLPVGPSKCQVIFDYFLEAHLKDDKAFIERSLVDSERVQVEDIMLCEGVQRGLESPAYCRGRYAPGIEKAMHHFHQLLRHNLKN